MAMKQKVQQQESAITVFEDLKAELRGYCIQSVSDISGVSQPTLYNWINDITRKPRLDTIARVATAVGFDLRLVRVGAATTKRRRHLRVVK